MTTKPILISKREAASLLNVSVGLVEKLIRRRHLVPVKLGRRVLLRSSDVEALTITRQPAAIEDSGTVH